MTPEQRLLDLGLDIPESPGAGPAKDQFTAQSSRRLQSRLSRRGDAEFPLELIPQFRRDGLGG